MNDVARLRGVAPAVAVVALVAAGALALVTRGDGGGPARPAGPVPAWARPLVEATTLPPGWYRVPGRRSAARRSASARWRTGWAERVTYRHLTDPYDVPYGEVTFTTTSGATPARWPSPQTFIASTRGRTA